MNPLVFYFSVIVFIFSSTTKAVENTPAAVGFWEELGVRKAFEYKQGEWHTSLIDVDNAVDLKKAASRYEWPLKWTLFFDGKTYGELSTKPFSTYSSYSENGLQKIVSKEPKLNFRKVAKEFSGWNGEKIRPILAFNTKTLSDPDHWKTGTPQSIQPFALQDIKKRLKGKIHYCKDKSCEEELLNQNLNDTDITQTKFYSDSKGNKLFAIALNFSPKLNAYCEIEGDQCHGEGPFWYLSTASGDTQFLTKAAALIETADLNNDGASEFLFWLNEYNKNGYELVDGKSHKAYDSVWSYH